MSYYKHFHNTRLSSGSIKRKKYTGDNSDDLNDSDYSYVSDDSDNESIQDYSFNNIKNISNNKIQYYKFLNKDSINLINN